MNKVVLSTVAAFAVVAAAPAFAADMPVKAAPAPAVAAPASPWDVLFGVAFTTDYELRGISQSAHKPAVQGYTELDFKAADWVTLYAGVWGSSLYTGFANAEFDISGGARFSAGAFGLDVGYVYYDYPDGVPNGFGSFGEFYAKPSYKVADWLTIAGVIDGGNNFNNGLGIVGSKSALYYSANAVITLPWTPVTGVTISVNPEIGHQTYGTGVKTSFGNTDYTWWDVGVDFNWKAITLDLRYWDTDAKGTLAGGGAGQCFVFGGHPNMDACSSKFVAMLKFDSAISQLK